MFYKNFPLMLAQADQAPLDQSPMAEQPANTNTQQPGSPPDTTNNEKPQNPGMGWFLPVMIAAFVLMIIMSGRSTRQERKRRQELLGKMKKGDKVVTRGGVLGTIVEVRDNEVVLKVDENSNTRIKFDRHAIEMIREEKETVE